MTEEPRRMSHAETCPTCGSAVRVVSSDEGTSYYEPLVAAVPPGLAIEAERLAKAMSVAYKSVGSWDDFDDAVVAFAEATVREYAALSSPETTPAGASDREREHREEDATGRHWWRCVPLIETTPAGVLPDGHSLLLEAMEWIGIVAVTGAKAEDAERWLREHDDGRGDWDFSPAGVLDEAALAKRADAAAEYYEAVIAYLDPENQYTHSRQHAMDEAERALAAALGRSGSDR